MSAVAYASQSSFAERIFQLLDIVDYRVARTEAEREDIYRLRYEAYRREGAISPNFSRMLFDKYDEADNVWIFGLYIEGKLASSMRMHVASTEQSVLPGASVFPDFVDPEIAAGKVILDPTRFVTDQALSRIYPGLPYATLRLCWMAAVHFDADHFLATVRGEHQGFYRRVFGHQTRCQPRPYPSLTKPICLMTVYHGDVAEQVHHRYPFFRSSFFERRTMFARPERREAYEPSRGRPMLHLMTGADDAGSRWSSQHG